MKKSFKIASAAVLTSVFALTLTFCGSKPAETTEAVDTVATETVAPVVADTTTTAADTTTSAQ